MKKNIFTLLLVLIVQLNFIFAQENSNREFRGIWVATVGNIDWPSKNNLSTEDQKKEVTRLLDLFKSLNLNVVIFQIRPVADAFYNSKYEPWSSYLTGSNNKAPLPYYDPLAFIINETHKRGMEFHAWLNPYRAMININEFQSNPFRLTYEKPDWFINYGKNKYFDPGLPQVRSYTNKIVEDIVQNYDIDAIHFDDYFYPYKIEGEIFDDDYSFKNFGGNFYPDQRDDWRRKNVDLIIEELHHTIKRIKPWVQFGISPFGVWRNKSDDLRGSATEAGQTNYDDLYADIILWMKNDWIDYILPQAYWHIGHERADYEAIVNWWANQPYPTNLYIGQGLYRTGNKNRDKSWSEKNPTEIERQLHLNKKFQNIGGSAFFSAKTLVNNPMNINQILVQKFYKHPILPPVVNKNIKQTPEAVEQIELTRLKNKNMRISWEPVPENEEKKAVKFMVFGFKQGDQINLQQTDHIIALTGKHYVDLKKKEVKNMSTIVIQAVSRNNNTSVPTTIQIK